MSLSAIPSDALARRIHRLLGNERETQVQFLLHLGELDRRREWARLGYPSIWEYCRRELKLLDGAIWRRTRCASVLRRFGFAADYLRDGRLAMTTLALLTEVLTDENARTLLDRAAGKSKDGVAALVADARGPFPAPKEMIRKLPTPTQRTLITDSRRSQATGSVQRPDSSNVEQSVGLNASDVGALFPGLMAPTLLPNVSTVPTPALGLTSESAATSACPALAADETRTVTRPTPPAEVTPIGDERFVMRFTVDREFREKFEKVKSILSHGEPSGEIVRVISRAFDLVLAGHAKRSTPRPPRRRRQETASTASRVSAGGRAAGPDATSRTPTGLAVARPVEPIGKPARPTAAREASRGRTPRPSIPVEVERIVRTRDRDRCTWTMASGKRCESTWQLELDHCPALARGGTTTVEGLRLLCRAHNEQHAREDFGDRRVERFKKRHFAGEVGGGFGAREASG